jgi:hypothetical protein
MDARFRGHHEVSLANDFLNGFATQDTSSPLKKTALMLRQAQHDGGFPPISLIFPLALSLSKGEFRFLHRANGAAIHQPEAAPRAARAFHVQQAKAWEILAQGRDRTHSDSVACARSSAGQRWNASLLISRNR